MSEESKGRRLPGTAVSKVFPDTCREREVTTPRVAPADSYIQKSSALFLDVRKAAKVLPELPTNQTPHKTGALKYKQSKSNSNISTVLLNRELKGRTPSFENVSRVAKSSKIPRATSGRKGNGDLFIRSTKNKPLDNAGRSGKKPEKISVENSSSLKDNYCRLDSSPSTSDSVFSLPLRASPPTATSDCGKILLGRCESNNSKSFGDFEDSFGPVSDDELLDISGDVTIRKEALDIAVKLASRTSISFEESSLSFPELAMLDLLSGSDLNLSLPKSDLSFTIFGDMDTVPEVNAIDRPRSLDFSMECSGPLNSKICEVEPTVDARSPSPTELPLSSRTPNAPVSIITSVTSIMSLDTGYQGDGELSRPESRSAEVDPRPKIPSAENGVQIKSIHFDDAKTMTDSDFFTESDADAHDDLSAAAAEIGSGKGDRRAQVIDGTLYGGANLRKHSYTHNDNENRTGCADNANVQFLSNGYNDDMASSGIFSDVEKKSDGGSHGENVTGEMPSSLTKNLEEFQNPVVEVDDKKDMLEESEGMVKSSSGESSRTIQESLETVTGAPCTVTMPDCEKSAQKWVKNTTIKNKMPNRNVTSKVKVLIETSQPKAELRPKTVRKGKWDAVMDRIAQGKEENKYTSHRFREIKSKVYQSTKSTTIGQGEAEAEVKVGPINSSQLKARSRRNVRVRNSESSLVSSKTSRKPASANSSQRSSTSDISVPPANKLLQQVETAHNGIRAKSASATVINSLTNNSNISGNKHKVKTLKMVQKKSSPVAGKDLSNQKNGVVHIPPKDKSTVLFKELKHSGKAFETFAVLFSYCVNDLDALSMPLVKKKLEDERQKCEKFQLNVREVERQMKEQLSDKALIIDSLESSNSDLKKKIEELTLLVTNLKAEEENMKDKLASMKEQLRIEIAERVNVEEELKQENKDLLYKIEEANKVNDVLKKLHDKLKLEQAAERQENANVEGHQKKELLADSGKGEISNCSQCGLLTSDRLESEVESLRQVLALKTDEVSELRRQELFLRENADRVPKLVSTITLLEGKVENFQTQLSSQTEANRDLEKRNYHLEEELKMIDMQKLRLTQKNEELEYKLRQYAEALRQLVSEKNLTEDDIRNAYLYQKTPQKSDCSLIDSLPAQMKGVVQKSDSVSYMLEMTEDSSEIVTNIIRRAESMRYSSRSQTLPKKKRSKTYSVSSAEALSPFEDYGSTGGEKPSSSSAKFSFDKVRRDAGKTPKKVVKLNPNDFIPDSIELSSHDHCEIIEITKNFDKTIKSTELSQEMSLSSCSSSSENGNHFDIESDNYCSGQEPDNVAEKEGSPGVLPQYHVDERSNDITSFVEDVKGNKYSTFRNVPQTSGGEALLVSEDETPIDSS